MARQNHYFKKELECTCPICNTLNIYEHHREVFQVEPMDTKNDPYTEVITRPCTFCDWGLDFYYV